MVVNRKLESRVKGRILWNWHGKAHSLAMRTESICTITFYERLAMDSSSKLQSAHCGCRLDGCTYICEYVALSFMSVQALLTHLPISCLSCDCVSFFNPRETL